MTIKARSHITLFLFLFTLVCVAEPELQMGCAQLQSFDGIRQENFRSGNVTVGKIEDEFSVSPMGQACYEIPIPVLSGTGGLAPQLSITYNSSNKGGLFGYGFDLSGLSIISRVPQNRFTDHKAGFVNFSSEDKFAMDGVRLIPVSDGYADSVCYSTERDSYARIISYGDRSNPSSFIVKTKDGLTYEYLPNTIILDSSSTASGIYWMLTKVKDTKGNYFTVSYNGDNETNEIYPTRIDYTGNDDASLSPYASVRFSYANYPEYAYIYIYGAIVSRQKHISSISLYSSEAKVGEFLMEYIDADNKKLLSKITEYAQDGTQKPSTTFEWNLANGLSVHNVCYNQSSYLYKCNFVIGDYNGDGKSDFVATPQNSNAAYDGWQLYISQGDTLIKYSNGGFRVNGEFQQAVSGDYNGDGYDDLVVMVKNQYGYYVTDLYVSTGYSLSFSKCVHTEQRKYNIHTIETKGDGAADLLLCFNNTKECKIYNSDMVAGQLVPLNGPYTRNCSHKWDRVEMVDFNGDGLTDILNLTSNGFFLMLADGYGTYTEEKVLPNYANHDVYCGDFNGDGKTDLMITSWNGTAWSLWRVGFSNGVDNLWCHTVSPPPFQTNDRQIFVVDANGDGFDDFYAIDKTGAQYTMSYPHLYINDGTGSFIEQPSGAATYPLDKWNFYFGDFNGDGKTDFLCSSKWQGNNNWRGYQLFLMPSDNHLLLGSIEDGLGNTTEVSYKYMSDPIVHVRGTNHSYPLSSFSSSWPVVHRVKTPNGTGGQDSTTYKYHNAIIHRDGRGVLGFEKVVAKDETNNTTTTTKYEVEGHKYVMEVKHTETRVGTRLVSESDYQYTPLSSYPAVFSDLLASKVEKTYEYNSGVLLSKDSTSYEYDNYGNVTKTVTLKGDITTTAQNTYTNDADKWILGRLRESTVTKSSATETKVRHARFEYDASSGLLTAEYTEPDNVNLGFKKTYEHDAFGNIVRSTTTPNNTSSQSRTDQTVYDAKGRYLIRRINSLGHVSTDSIDENRGLLMKATDANGIATSYTYDSFGRTEATTTPVTNTTVERGWSAGMTNAPANALYYTRTQTTGEPYRLEFFDCLGRSLRIVTTNVNNRKVYVDVVYNAKGQVEKTSEPYIQGDQPCWNTNTYDACGRLLTQTDAAGNATSYAYDGFTTTTTDALGHRIVRVVDMNGNLIQSRDHEEGTIDYQYDVEGHCTQLTGPRTTVTMAYDLLGNRRQLNDPDLGVVDSEYNAFSELVRQTDSKGTTTYAYDQGGRLITETRPDVTITNQYDTEFVGALSNTTASNSTGVSYNYDTYGRVVRQRETVGSKSFVIQTAYNQENHVETITYPSGFAVRHQYADNGTLLRVKNASTQAMIWQLDTVNARGQATSQTYGNLLSTKRTFDARGNLLSVITPDIQRWNYAYDAVSNLVRRTDVQRNLMEDFEYDALNRLVTVKQNGVVSQRMTYDNAGNITSKTGVGTDFVYQEGTNRLVSFNACQPMPKLWNNIQYTSFHKISRVNCSGQSMTLTYGPYKSRVKAVTTADGTTETKYYAGNLYEEITKGGEIRRLCYVYAGDRAVAIHESSSTHGQKMLYLHRDHLGSVQAYSDASGNLVQKLSYDAWGRRRDPATWEYYDRIADAHAENPWGFTGHEHLDMFEMVNMDGRMYDPVIGRFLSPDPIVQAPDFTQGLNRYTYCLNNPLSLTDPSGYSWLSHNWKSLVASIVGITVSAITAGSGSGLGIAIIAGAAGGAAGALTSALLNGSNIGQIAKSTFTGAFWGGVSGFLNFGAHDTDLLAKLFKHTFSQGWLEGIQGGNMFHGFMMGAVSGAGGHYIDKYANSLGKAGEIAANAALSGTVSEIGGGKFANGAITGAYSIMFNDMMHRRTKQEMKKIIEADGVLSFEEAYYWYKHGKGTTLTVDASKIDLNFVDISGMKVGDKISVSTWKGGVDQGIVYGSISIEYVGNNAVLISDDKYDFDMHSWSNIGESVRNIETIFADWVHGTGTPFKIHFKGYNKIK